MATIKFPLFFLCFTLTISLSYSTDAISANQSLTGAQTIVSSGGNFELGFFKPGNSSNYYIGTWYKKIPLQTIVWVANRDTPISDNSSAELKIFDGNLVLFNESKSPIWSTNMNATSPSISRIAVLRDDGNLALIDSESSATPPVWQSFDNPGNTWLPGAKIGYNKRTGSKQLLTSWKNSEYPATGLFNLEFDPVEIMYISKWNRTEQYWTSGAWNGHIFSFVPEMRSDYIYNFSYVNNADESYFTYSVYNPSIIFRFFMDFSGQIKQQSWLEQANEWNLFWSQPQCEVYAFCGAYGTCSPNSLPFCNCVEGFRPRNQKDWNLEDYSAGCVRNKDLKCGSSNSAGERDRFLKNSQVGLPPHPQTVAVRSVEECENTCLDNCSCTAYAYDNNACSLWFGELMNLKQLSSNDGNGKIIHIRLNSSVFPSKKSSKGVIIGAVGGSVLVLALILGLMWASMDGRKKRFITKNIKVVEGTLVAFGYKDLQAATKNFSEKLGGGGFGSVFKGNFSESTVIAVKKLESINQGEKQFRTEVSTIGAIQHVNLVTLHGFCSDGNRKLLVYEYMPNGSLDSHLFNQDSSKVLDWKTRYHIALGTARGLSYLHEKCRDCIIHCDIKPENILLDAGFCPKVADFGLAKLIGRDFSRVLTTMRGTRGYLAPEWISGVPITAKADVYSYGMMLFEFISGRRNSEPFEDGKFRYFPTFASSVAINGGDLLSLLDHRFEGIADVEEVTRICKIACWCIQDDEVNRPSMGQIVLFLEGVLDVNTPPIPRSLQVFVDNNDHIVFFTGSSSSNNSSDFFSN